MVLLEMHFKLSQLLHTMVILRACFQRKPHVNKTVSELFLSGTRLLAGKHNIFIRVGVSSVHSLLWTL